MTLTVMKAHVLDLIEEQALNYDRFSETFVERAINLGCVDFIDKTEVLDSHWEYTTTTDMWYLLSPANYEITRIEWYDASEDKRHVLAKRTMRQMDELYPLDTDNYDSDADWQSITGDPLVWIPREHDVFGIYPACDVTDDTLYVYGRKKHTTLDDDNTTSDIPDQYHHIPCLYAARMLLRSDNDEKAPSFEKWYKEEVMMAKREIMDRKKKMPGQWRLYTY